MKRKRKPKRDLTLGNFLIAAVVIVLLAVLAVFALLWSTQAEHIASPVVQTESRSAVATPSSIALLSKTPEPTLTRAILLEGETVVNDNLALTLLEHRLEGCYTSRSGNQVCPDQGAALLWVHFRRENHGSAADLPIYSCFSFLLLYQGKELDSLWYHSYGDYHPERESWIGGGCKELYGGYSDEGWVCFEVPAGISLNEATLRIKSYEGPYFEHIWKLEKR
jgi:hypothetical protein